MPQPVPRIEFTNHLMFNAVLTENEGLCKRLIETILGKWVESVEYIDDEVTIQPMIDARAARLDVLALIDGEYVDIEMQVWSEPDVERRCRFYHSAIATRYMPKGTSYASVPRSYVIFICLTDPLGAGLARYELATTCRNAPDVPVDDGATSILLNACAWEQEKNPELSGLLQYTMTGYPKSSLAQDIAAAVEDKNLDRKWVRASMGVMTYEHELIALNQALEKRRAELEEKRAELEAAQADITAAQADIAAAQAEAQAAQAEAQAAQADAAAAQADAATAQADAAAAQADAAAAHAELDASRALQELSLRMHAVDRIDEYFGALGDQQRVKELLKEFGLVE